MKQNWKYYISPVLLGCILLAGLWYWRGVSLPELVPEIDPAAINVYVTALENDELQSRHFEIDADSEEGQIILSAISGLTIHRPPTNLLYQILKPTAAGKIYGSEDYGFVVRVFDESGTHAALQFNVDSWTYDTPGQVQYLPCSVRGGQDTGRSLGRTLWDMAAEFDSKS